MKLRSFWTTLEHTHIHIYICVCVCFPQEELNVVLTKIKSRKAVGLDKIPLGVRKTRYDTMRCVRQADALFVCFGAKPNKSLSSRSPTSPEVEEERQVREKPLGPVGKGTQGGSVGEGKRREAVDNGERSALSWLSREWQSQQKSERWLLKPDELHRDRVNQCEKMSALLVHFVEFPRKPALVYKCMKSCTKSSHELPFLTLELT